MDGSRIEWNKFPHQVLHLRSTMQSSEWLVFRRSRNYPYLIFLNFESYEISMHNDELEMFTHTIDLKSSVKNIRYSIVSIAKENHGRSGLIVVWNEDTKEKLSIVYY